MNTCAYGCTEFSHIINNVIKSDFQVYVKHLFDDRAEIHPWFTSSLDYHVYCPYNLLKTKI